MYSQAVASHYTTPSSGVYLLLVTIQHQVVEFTYMYSHAFVFHYTTPSSGVSYVYSQAVACHYTVYSGQKCFFKSDLGSFVNAALMGV